MKIPFQRLIRFSDPSGAIFYGEAPVNEHDDDDDDDDDWAGRRAAVYEGDHPWVLKPTGDTAEIAQVLCPLASTPLVYGVGLNYKGHIAEAGFPSPPFPTVFIKPPDTLNAPYANIAVDRQCVNMDYEGELAVIIGQDTKNASPDAALDHVLGYAVVNDVSSRYWQMPDRSGQQHGYAKGFDGFAPLGPVIVSPAVVDTSQMTLVTRVNGAERQRARLDDLLHGVGEIIAHLSRATTLRAGTVIMTGTPGGVAAFMHPPAWLQEGDVVEVAITGIGTIRNRFAFTEDHNVPCVFQPPHVRTRNKVRETNKMLRDRIARLESMLSNPDSHRRDAPAMSPKSPPTQQPLPPLPLLPPATPAHSSPGLAPILTQQPSDAAVPLSSAVSPPSQETSHVSEDRLAPPAAVSGTSPPAVMDTAFGQQSWTATQQPLSPEPSHATSAGSPSLESLEYHGPSSYLAICSQSATTWLSEKTGNLAPLDGLGELSMSIARRMKLDHSIHATRQPEPDAQTALRYAQAYFDASLETIFGVVNRKRFDARLQATLDGTEPDTFAWYALRNTVYAGGCSVVLSRESGPEAFARAQAQSWAYFENALSVHTDLVYVRSDLLAIQALMAMAFYAEGFGNPALEYMLVSNAVRLAQSKGLHRQQPPHSLAISEDDRLERAWLFWVMYAYDKHVAFRSGRPSAISDEDVSCEIPNKAVAGSGISVDFVTQVVQHSRIASDISRELTSFRAASQAPEVIVVKMEQQEARLRAWFQGLPPVYQHPPLPGAATQGQGPSDGLHQYHRVFLQYCYHGSLIAIHSPFAYPWNLTGRLGPAERLLFQDQVAVSTNMVVQSSRQIILATRWFEPQGSCPTWSAPMVPSFSITLTGTASASRLVFFYPLLGLINIFIAVLRAPLDESTAANLALAEVAAGHFGYLEYLSNNHITFPYVAEIGRLARAVVKAARERRAKQPLPTRHASTPSTAAAADLNQMWPLLAAGPVQDDLSGAGELPLGESFALDLGSFMDTESSGLENWPTFVPSLSAVSSMITHGFPQDMDLFPG
ncbi:hypothetical protein BJY00DRAFT_313232 [Aspergillus carlsbadensis]|nr:hypothetical protein BJY00DRAFT_313232 [Aspergillus carlsbadensis]